jgi:hypothetical protein
MNTPTDEISNVLFSWSVSYTHIAESSHSEMTAQWLNGENFSYFVRATMPGFLSDGQMTLRGPEAQKVDT